MHSNTKYIEETCRKMQPNVYLMAKMPGEATAIAIQILFLYQNIYNTNAQTNAFFWSFSKFTSSPKKFQKKLWVQRCSKPTAR